MLFGDSVQTSKHDGKDLVDVLLDEAENVLVVPEVQSSFCHLGQEKRSINQSINQSSLTLSKNAFFISVLFHC